MRHVQRPRPLKKRQLILRNIFRRHFVLWLSILALYLLSAGFALKASARNAITIFAASSLAPALEEVKRSYEARSGIRLRLSLGASSTLARQIEQGAPADLFMTAHPLWMDYLAEKELIETSTRHQLFTNGLVLVKSPYVKEELAFNFDKPDQNLPALLPLKTAVADPVHVPLGIYAKQALEQLGLWDELAPDLIRAADARSVLTLLSRGEADLGIIYQSDLRSINDLQKIVELPKNLHDSITYLVAIVQGSPKTEEAQEFLRFITGPEGKRLFEKLGFEIE